MIKTPYYLIDKQKLLGNLEKIAYVREHSGAKALLALKCFATWARVRPHAAVHGRHHLVVPLRAQARPRSSSAGETHAYSASPGPTTRSPRCLAHCRQDHLQFHKSAESLFGSVVRHHPRPAAQSRQSRLAFDLADPARPFSRLGEWDLAKVEPVMDMISGFMIHNNCENGDFALFDQMLGDIEQKFGPLSEEGRMGQPRRRHPFHRRRTTRSSSSARRLKRFAGDMACRSISSPAKPRSPKSTTLEVTVLDTLFNGKNLAIVDSRSRPTCSIS